LAQFKPQIFAYGQMIVAYAQAFGGDDV